MGGVVEGGLRLRWSNVLVELMAFGFCFLVL